MKNIELYLTKKSDKQNNNAFTKCKKGMAKAEIFIDGGELSVSKTLYPTLWCESTKESGIEVDLCIYERADNKGVRMKYREYKGSKCIINIPFIDLSYKDFNKIAIDLCDLPQTEETSEWLDNVLQKGL